MAGPRITEVSLSPDGSSRYAGATHISVLMELLAKQLDSRFPRRDRRGKDYSVFKVQKVIGMLSYTFLRNAFRTALLNEMELKIGPSFKIVKSRCYREHKDGFYVYAKPNNCEPQTVIKYIGRYLGRPVIATSRIDKYDGSFVTFHYNRHEDDQYVEETLPVMEFIQRLIRHIPEKHYKMIRYGGIYARHREIDKKTTQSHIP